MKTAVGDTLGNQRDVLLGIPILGVNPLPYQTWKKVQSDAPLQAALMENLPESGIYHVPTLTRDEKKMEVEFKKGPIAFIVLAAKARI